MFMVCEKEQTSLRMFMSAKSLDVANSDDYRIDMMWEVMTPDQHSHQVAVRISSRLEWISEPNFASKALIEKQYKNNVTEMLQFFAKWAPTKVEENSREREWSSPEQKIIDDVEDHRVRPVQPD